MVFYGGKKPDEEIKTCYEGVNFVHLKDKVGLDNGWNFPAVGAGDLNLLGFLQYHGREGLRRPAVHRGRVHRGLHHEPQEAGGTWPSADKAVKDSFDYLRAHGIV